ncbi:MAG: hypothetical protein ABR589_04085 [Chthoniobacterales bacterium]
MLTPTERRRYNPAEACLRLAFFRFPICAMRFGLALLLCAHISRAAEPADATLTAQQQFRDAIARKAVALQKKNISAFPGREGWFFLTSELRFLAQGRFWGDAAAKTAHSRKSESADPIPAITDFNRQLKERGIELLLVPVPAKAAIYPDKLGVESTSDAGSAAAPYLPQFYELLRARGVNVLDLSSFFAKEREHARGSVYCQTDSHWSGVGCMLAAQVIAERIRDKIPPSQSPRNYSAEWKQAALVGDLISLLPADVSRPQGEKISIRAISQKSGGAPVQADTNSPLLLLGDSHTLVFHEFHAERGGLIDQLAHELGFAPDLIGTRGSGATAVRVSLYRKARSDPAYLAKKKVVVWCLAAREFTEADQGWVVQPVAP